MGGENHSNEHRGWGLDELLHQIAHGAPSRREEAVRRLGELGTSAAIAMLEAALNDPEPSVRHAAVQALAAAHATQAIPSLVRVLEEDQDDSVREQVVEVLRDFADERAALALGRALRADPAVLVRIAAADALGTCDATLVADALVDSALDSSEYESVSQLAAAALVLHPDIGVPTALLARLPSSADADHIRLELAAGLARRGHSAAIAPLLDALSAGDRETRRIAAESLSPFLHDSRVRAGLERALADQAIEVRTAAEASLRGGAKPPA